MTGAAAMMRTSLRIHLRSRLALPMLLAVLAADIALPLAIRGDGTLEGLIRLHLTYTLGLASFLLGLFSLWAGCGGISREAETRTLHLLVTKPVPRLSIWLGKWFALLVLDAALLSVALAASAATLAWRIHSPAFTDADRAVTLPIALASLTGLYPDQPDVSATVEADLERLHATGRLPDLPETTIRAQLRHAALVRANTIHPGAEHLWTFTPPPHIPRDAPAWMQFHCDTSAFGVAETAIYCYPGSLEAALAGALDISPAWQPTPIVTGMPALLPTPQRLDTFADPRSGIFSLTVKNADPAQATLFFDPDDGVLLRVRTGTFAGNYLRAGLLLYGRLALLAAVGLALGTFFSTPVAAFASVVLLLLLQLSGFIGGAAQADRAVFVANVAPFGAHVHSPGDAEHSVAAEAAPSPTPLARAAATALYWLYRGTWACIRPLMDDDAIDRLATATAIPAREVAASLLRRLLLLPLLLGLLSAAVLRTREWALPAES